MSVGPHNLDHGGVNAPVDHRQWQVGPNDSPPCLARKAHGRPGRPKGCSSDSPPSHLSSLIVATAFIEAAGRTIRVALNSMPNGDPLAAPSTSRLKDRATPRWSPVPPEQLHPATNCRRHQGELLSSALDEDGGTHLALNGVGQQNIWLEHAHPGTGPQDSRVVRRTAKHLFCRSFFDPATPLPHLPFI